MKIPSLILSFVLFQQCVFAEAEKLIPHDPANLSLRNEVQHAIDKGLAWLVTKQNVNGYWDMQDHPALTALVLTAYERDPSGQYKEAESVKKGFDFLLSCAHPDGGIYKKNELLNYNTSVSVMALLATGDSKYEPLLRKARMFLIGQQMPVEKGKVNPYAGGIGYGDDDPHSDMSNMVFALEALHYTSHLQGNSEAPASKEKDLDWQAAIDFLQRCQNLPGTNKADWVSEDVKDKGGFVYTPDESPAGETKLPNGRTVMHSYGSMSYAGLLSYIYAGLKHDDPRVTAVIDWVRNNYTLEKNPAVGKEGLYYYYHTLAKALATYGEGRLKLADGKEIDWRNDLAKQMINLQHDEGYWVNDNGRYWEKDPVLVTAYSVLALEVVYRAQ
jgi:squalene-hopene/tetraprenyl-beta-curcumene cyclase